MKVQSAKGVKDVSPEEKILKDEVVGKLKDVFELYGFAPLETSIIKRYDTLAAKFAAGEESDALRETFRLRDQGKRELGLRFDLTVPLAAFVAKNPTLKLPFKRYELGEVFRDGPIKLGRYRQFTQMDVDIIGVKSMLADAEIVAMTDAVFRKLGFDVVIKVNNRKLLNGILEQIGVEQREEVIIAIDKLDKIGQAGVAKELIERGCKKSQVKKIFSFVKEGVTLKELRTVVVNEEAKEGLLELKELFNYLKKMSVKKVKFDISLARGLAYYTGTAFEVFLKKGEVNSSLAGGGRYDQMVGGYLGGGRDVPALGISFGLSPVMDVLRLKKEMKRKTLAKIYIVPLGMEKESLAVAQELRNGGVATSFALGKKGLSKNLQYANVLGIPYVLIIGEDEVKKKKVLLRDMKSGEESLLSVKQVVKRLQ